MYKCLECGCVFTDEEAELIEEYEEHNYGIPFSSEITCPSCGSDEHEEAFQCSSCKEYFFENQLEYHFCKKCREPVLKKFRDFMNTFEDDERQFLNDFYEGKYLNE